MPCNRKNHPFPEVYPKCIDHISGTARPNRKHVVSGQIDFLLIVSIEIPCFLNWQSMKQLKMLRIVKHRHELLRLRPNLISVELLSY